MAPTKVLNIFDFDGTLFRSPDPNPTLWAPTFLGKIKSPTSQSGLGWFQELETLMPPYVDENPDESWFNPSVLEACRKSMSDPQCITVLLTGRLLLYWERIIHIVGCAGLKFDHFGLKTVPNIFTMDFKTGFINDLIQKYKADLHKIVIYEDREEHSSKLDVFLKNTGLEYQVVVVKPDVTILPKEKEVELVKKLIAKNSPGLQLVEHTTYTGVMLDRESHKALLKYIEIPQGWHVKAHHMTICLGEDIPENTVKLGDVLDLKITAIGFDSRALAVKVDGAPTTNSVAHITVAIAPEAKPVDSNFLQEWVPVEDIKDGVLTQSRAAPKPEDPEKDKAKNGEKDGTKNQSPKKGEKKESKKKDTAGAKGEANNGAKQEEKGEAKEETNKEEKKEEKKEVKEASNGTVVEKVVTTTVVVQETLGENFASLSISETVVTTTRPVSPPRPTIKIRLPQPPPLRGTVAREVFLGPKKPDQAPDRGFSALPKGVSVGDLVKRHHPGLQGKDLGAYVRKVIDWSRTKTEVLSAEEVEEYVKALKNDS